MEPDNLHPLKGKRLDCMIKLIATDMDGTLLDERGEVDLPRLERLLDHLDQKGFALSLRQEMNPSHAPALGSFGQTGDSGRSQWSSDF